MEQNQITTDEDYSLPGPEIPFWSSSDGDENVSSDDVRNSDGFVRTLATTVALLLLSIPSVRTSFLQILFLPQKAIKILATAFEETTGDGEGDMSIADDDEFEEEGGESKPRVGFVKFLFMMIRRRINYLMEMLCSISEIRLVTGKIILGSDREQANSGTGASSASSPIRNVKEIASGVVASAKKKIAKTVVLPNIAMPQIDHRDNLQEKNRIAKEKYDRISFDAGNIEPAFLNDEDYSKDWLMYDPSKGKLVSRKDLLSEMQMRVNGTTGTCSSQMQPRHEAHVETVMQ